MTKHRPLFLLLFSFVSSSILSAAPPDQLAGKFISLSGDRIEFTTASSGIAGSESHTYTYGVRDGSTSDLTVTYSSGRIRMVVLNFLFDGTPNGFSEFDIIDPNLPPFPNSGDFELGDLATTPPVIDSSAPDSLTGLFAKVDGTRYEFLTDTDGRIFIPGDSIYFSYEYSLVDSSSGKATLSSADSAVEVELQLLFDSEGLPLTFVLTENENGELVNETEGELEVGTNLHLGDLRILDGDSIVGEDWFNAIGSRQTVSKRLRSVEPVSYAVSLSNDGDTDSFLLRGTKGRRTFSVKYFNTTSGENVTAAVVAGTLNSGELEHDETFDVTAEITPKRSRGAMVTSLKAESETVEDAKDRVKMMTKVKARNNRGNGRENARGRGNKPERENDRGRGNGRERGKR